MKEITWIAYNTIEDTFDRYIPDFGRVADHYSSSFASFRYRLLIPARELGKMGYRISLLVLGPDDALDAIAPRVNGKAVILSKVISPSPDIFEKLAQLTLAIARVAKMSGGRVIADINDDHFARPGYGEYFRVLVNAADVNVASTPEMAAIIQRHTSRPVHISGDAFEGPKGTASFDPPRRKANSFLGRVIENVSTRPGGRSPLRLLWFGHRSNLDSVRDLLPRLPRLVLRHALELHLVTSPGTGVEEMCTSFNEDYAPACALRFSPWSLEMTWQSLSDCDLVVIPVGKNDRAKLVKSPNRLIEAVWAGRFVVANPIPSYQEFGDFVWLGDNIVDGIEWALDHPREARRRIAAGQGFISGNYAPEVIARQWDAALKTAFSGAPAPVANNSAASLSAFGMHSERVRLNLGCGDKILPGYVNVDIAESRCDVKPDVVCDLRRLTPFADSFADEVLSVHVVEHFWRWEVVELLKEWVRVLKPGGKMILECPNLLSACEEFLRIPDAASGPGAEGQRTMWVFYGDPAWRDPLMVHRWGYTPHSLAQIMLEAGLVDTRQEPAQYKLREPRDMRIVGEKPV